MPKKESYNEDSIKVLKGLLGVRKRPSMYIGELGNHSIFHLLKEVIENSVDEFSSHNNDFIGIQVSGSGPQTFTVVDYGRGIPVGINKETGISTLTAIMTELHSGGKFDSKAYGGRSRGLHGLGVSVVNALSSSFEVWTHRDKKWYYQQFNQGKPKSKVKVVDFPSSLKKLANKSKGTIIRYIPDYEILGKKSKLDIKVFQKWLADISNLNSGLTIRLITDEKEKTYLNKGGPKSYLKKMLENKKVEVIGKPFIYEADKITVAIQWTDYDSEDGISSFINGAATDDGGTHVQGLYDILNKVFKQFSNTRSKWTAQDIRYGIVGFINYYEANPEYDGQTKNKLVTKATQKAVSEELEKPLSKYLKEHKSTCQSIIKRAGTIHLAREQARAVTKAAAKIKNTGKILLPGKFKSWHSKSKVEDRELYLVEGDSAGKTTKDARDTFYQGVLTCKGKPINAAKAKLHLVLANEEIKNVLTVLNADMKAISQHKPHKNSFSCGKILLLPDADVDGWHIGVLWCTAFQLLTPEVFERGMVYKVEAPLFHANYKDKKYIGNTLKEIRDQLPKGAKVSISRIKGWGEIPWQMLREIAFNKKTRRLTKIMPIKKGKDLIYFDKVVGENTDTRKKLLGLD